MKHNELAVWDPGNQFPTKPGSVGTFATIPVWWRGFIFCVLPPRAFAIYMYLVMMTDENAISYPTAEQISRDMGLASDTQVYESLRYLQEFGFIKWKRSKLPNRRSLVERNVYQRCAPEFTLKVLLEKNKIDALLRPVPESGIVSLTDDISQVEPALFRGLRAIFEDDVVIADYVNSPDDKKREVLIRLLDQRFEKRVEKAKDALPAEPRLAPRDQNRLKARERMKRPTAKALRAELSSDINDVDPFAEAEKSLKDARRKRQRKRSANT